MIWVTVSRKTIDLLHALEIQLEFVKVLFVKKTNQTKNPQESCGPQLAKHYQV